MSRVWRFLLPVFLIAAFITTVLVSDARMSQTFDEGFHLAAGYRYIQCGDFGINAEHPPLVKMAAGLALRLSGTPAPAGGVCGVEPTTKGHGYDLGVDYLYRQGLNAQRVLMRARAATAIFAVLLLVTVFFYARYLFGYWAAVFALLLAVCEPTLIAHAALVTTDMAVSAGVLLTVFLLDRYLRKPHVGALIAAGLAVGLTLAVKHSGVLIVPIAIALVIADLWMLRSEWMDRSEGMRRSETGRTSKTSRLMRRLARSAGALAVIFAIAVTVLWATYGFRYWPRPHDAAMTLTLADFLTQVRAQGTTGVMPDHLIPFAAHWHLLPLAYLYGLVDVLNVSHPGLPPFVLGRLLPHGVWYYFPVTFLIKSTPAFLALLLLSAIGGGWLRPERRRACVFLLLPVAIWYAMAMTSGLDIGYRHVLPTVALLAIFVSGGVLHLIKTRTRRMWTAVVGVLVTAHVISAVVAFPHYFSYADELLGGERQVYRYLTDSNNDWGQGLLETRRWLEARGSTDCWIAYDGAADLHYYGIPCRALPGNPGDLQSLPPETATGTFIVSGLSYAGVEWEPYGLHPYAVFHDAEPVDNIGGAMLVYRGTFDMRPIQAVSLTIRAASEADTQPEAALRDARAALVLSPTSVRARLAEAHALERLGQREAARESFARALEQAERTGAAWYPAQIAEANRGLGSTAR